MICMQVPCTGAGLTASGLNSIQRGVASTNVGSMAARLPRSERRARNADGAPSPDEASRDVRRQGLDAGAISVGENSACQVDRSGGFRVRSMVKSVALRGAQAHRHTDERAKRPQPTDAALSFDQ